MMKILRLIITLIIVIVFVNCNTNNHLKKDFYFLNFNDSVNINVAKTAISNKALVLNDSIVLYKTSKLIYEKLKPKWLFKKTKNKELFKNVYIYKPDVSEIEAPYKLIKYKKSNIFQIIKETDTLTFDFENFEKLDYWL